VAFRPTASPAVKSEAVTGFEPFGGRPTAPSDAGPTDPDGALSLPLDWGESVQVLACDALEISWGSSRPDTLTLCYVDTLLR
jgi:hypothetical protein